MCGTGGGLGAGGSLFRRALRSLRAASREHGVTHGSGGRRRETAERRQPRPEGGRGREVRHRSAAIDITGRAGAMGGGWASGDERRRCYEVH